MSNSSLRSNPMGEIYIRDIYFVFSWRTLHVVSGERYDFIEE